MVEKIRGDAPSLILHVLFSSGDERGMRFGDIEEQLTLGKSTISRVLKDLEEAGIVDVDQPAGSRTGRAPIYRVNRDAYEQLWAVYFQWMFSSPFNSEEQVPFPKG